MKIIKRIIKILVALGLLGILSFYLLVGIGLSPTLQTLWVTTAMTTMEHKWLATAIIPKEKIYNIMEENYVDDRGYVSDIFDLGVDVGQPNSDNILKMQIDIGSLLESEHNYMLSSTYEIDGYEKLEDGLYLKEVSDTGWRGYVMLVQDPLRVSLVDTPKQFTEGWTVKKMTQSVGGVSGINGGGFNDGPNYNSNGGVPSGLLIEDGVLVSPKQYNDETYPMIGLNNEGVLVLRHTTAKWAIDNGIEHAVSFSPYLIVNGEGTIKKGTGGWGIAPRTAIGQRKTGEILFLVIDGRQPTWSIGVDLKVLQDVLLKENCINAAMLDGGSSTVMVYNDEFVNKPSLGKERYINNAWVIK